MVRLLVGFGECMFMCVCGYTCLWRSEDNLECHFPGTAIYLLETGFLIGPEFDKSFMPASKPQGSCQC